MQDSVIYGTWKDEYSKYNCYAFAIDRTEIPAEFVTDRQSQPGNFSDQGITSFSVSSIANIVKDDLENLSYRNVSISATNNYSNYNHTIVLRCGRYDYHCMSYLLIIIGTVPQTRINKCFKI